MAGRDSSLEPFDALIGTWATEATHPAADAVVAGSVRFEWLEGGHFLLQRSRNDHELFPDAICVIGAPEAGGLVMESFDSRGVLRTYGAFARRRPAALLARRPRVRPALLRHARAPLLRGLWQLADTPGDRQDDLNVSYRRRD